MTFEVDLIKTFPEEPGVYIMKNAKEEILYIGKAKSLKSRLRQYFQPGLDTRAMIPLLLSQLNSIQTIVTLNEKEALILESNLIKQHQPKYNILLKDDKTFISLMVNADHMWPMVKLVRYKQKPIGGLFFGPYPSSYYARNTLEILQKLFPLRQCSDYELTHRKKPCLLYEMKRCLAPCVQKCTKPYYDDLVKKVIQFLKGKDDTILHTLKEKIKIASEQLEFEQADLLFRLYCQVEEIYKNHQFIVQVNIEDCDVIGLHESGNSILIVILKFRDGKLVDSRNDFFRSVVETKESLLANYLLQYYNNNQSPSLILIPFLFDELEIIKEIFNEKFSCNIQFQIPIRGPKRSLLNMAEKNSKILLDQQLKISSDYEDILIGLEETLKLNQLPSRIECFDTSNLSNLQSVASMVTAIDGKLEKKHYRLYKIKYTDKGDDYSSMKEVLYRRYSKAKENDDLPDLIIVDGGKGQLNIVKNILHELSIVSCDIIAITKEDSRHDKGMTHEKIYITEDPNPIILPIRSQLLFFLQKIRDEAHRIAITYQRKLRSTYLIKSELDKVPGIGKKKKELLLKKFGSIKNISKATKEELINTKGITKKDAEEIINYFKN